MKIRYIVGAVITFSALLTVGAFATAMLAPVKITADSPGITIPAADTKAGPIDLPSDASASPPVRVLPSAKPVYIVAGDDIVHVGEDVPPGTYRAQVGVSEGCYWAKTRDSEGSDIIDNGIPTGGRPQVTLKRGQWFTSQGCPDWRKR